MRATASQVTTPADHIARRALPVDADDQVKPAAAPELPKTVPAPNPSDVLAGIHEHTLHAALGTRYLALKQRERERNPLYKSYLINGASGVYFAVDEPQGEPARSITIYNPTINVPAYVGIGGTDPTSAAGALPVAQFLTIPLQADVIKVGFNPTDLLANSATIFVFRWATVQPFAAE